MFSFCGIASGSSCAAKLAAESTEDTEEDGLVGDHIPVDVLPVVWELEDHCEEDVDMGVGLGAPSSARPPLADGSPPTALRVRKPADPRTCSG